MDGDSDKKAVEGIVNLLVGDTLAVNHRTHLTVKFIGVNLSGFEGEEGAFLSVDTEEIVGILHAEFLKSAHATVAVEVHDYTSEVKKQILYHLAISVVSNFDYVKAKLRKYPRFFCKFAP